MDDTTRYYLAEHLAALQREYALLKTALDQDTELQQIKQLLNQPRPQMIHDVEEEISHG